MIKIKPGYPRVFKEKKSPQGMGRAGAVVTALCWRWGEGPGVMLPPPPDDQTGPVGRSARGTVSASTQKSGTARAVNDTLIFGSGRGFSGTCAAQSFRAATLA